MFCGAVINETAVNGLRKTVLLKLRTLDRDKVDHSCSLMSSGAAGDVEQYKESVDSDEAARGATAG